MKVATFIKNLAYSWSEDQISTLSAALAYYTLFSVTPILLIIVDLAGFFLSEDSARNKIMHQIKELISPDIYPQINQMIGQMHRPGTGILAQVIGWVLIIIGASAVFSEMQSGLNHIWGVINPERGWFVILKQRLLSFIMVLGVAFLLLTSFFLSILITPMSTFIEHFWHIRTIDMFLVHSLSFVMAFLLFSMTFKILPDVKIPWTDIWFGAIITSILFHVGKYILGIYLSTVHLASAFGAAGSLILLLIWVYYSAQIFFIGAEITKVIAFGKNEIIKTRRHALKV